MKKTYVLFSIFFIAALVFASCNKSTNKFLSANFDEKTRNHKIIAVLPVEMVFMGKQPKDFTPDKIKTIEEAESKSFQESLYGKILSKEPKVDIQAVEKTNKLLAAKGITIQNSWTMPADELAKVLGVDAVVKSRIEKERYMSDLASFGTSVANTLASWGGIPLGANNKTNNIRGSCEVINSADGIALWRVTVKNPNADWNTPANDIIDRINSKFARNFPY